MSILAGMFAIGMQGPPQLDPKELECMQLVTLAQASEKANIIVLLVDHREFESLTLRDLRGKSLLDTRGLYAKQQKALSASSFHDVVDEING